MIAALRSTPVAIAPPPPAGDSITLIIYGLAEYFLPLSLFSIIAGMNKNFDNADVNNFTQKDLMLHLLQVSQHTVTREELKEDISKLEVGLKELKADLQQEMQVHKASIGQDMAKLESNIKEGK
jgi:hypothetical protein